MLVPRVISVCIIQPSILMGKTILFVLKNTTAHVLSDFARTLSLVMSIEYFALRRGSMSISCFADGFLLRDSILAWRRILEAIFAITLTGVRVTRSVNGSRLSSSLVVRFYSGTSKCTPDRWQPQCSCGGRLTVSNSLGRISSILMLTGVSLRSLPAFCARL